MRQCLWGLLLGALARGGHLRISRFGLIWRDRPKDLESILGLNLSLSIRLFYFDRVHGIRSLWSMSVCIGLLRAHCPYRNLHERKSRKEFVALYKFNFKIKRGQNHLSFCKDLFWNDILNIFFKSFFCIFAIKS